MYEHLKDYDSYTWQHHHIEECKDINAKKEYSFVGEKIEKHETCNLPWNLSIRS
jgi:hypothetical protein